ncbi:cupin domain-containing protein [Novosphingobium cyanobacteriorum]|uniref:Cupin domain-containing protein n=1 Tax=Novosphingobium cyanobacteriorum TaxID=3024215 RepID=A0ABT6CGG1_9SPHN|nr:cupin domain-containing protein [Novosphingobium cyanobacteriorum]MDF8332175.1 cupin domain-containing protein [Novosphingobium cyanobacteriorum]
MAITASKVKPNVAPIRRIVTGHDDAGRAVILSDEACPHVHSIKDRTDFGWTELWTTAVPADNSGPEDTVPNPPALQPAPGTLTFRVVEFPPDRHHKDPTVDDRSMFHRTRSVDFAIVLSGEIWGVVDEGEVLMKPGDTMIQRGTNHDWQNRSDEPARVAFVLIDAQPLG